MSSICFKQITCKNWHSAVHMLELHHHILSYRVGELNHAVHMLELHHHILSHRVGEFNQQFVTDRFRNY